MAQARTFVNGSGTHFHLPSFMTARFPLRPSHTPIPFAANLPASAAQPSPVTQNAGFSAPTPTPQPQSMVARNPSPGMPSPGAPNLAGYASTAAPIPATPPGPPTQNVSLVGF